MFDLAALADSQLHQRHRAALIEGRAAQSSGNRDEAYAIAQEVRRMTAEMRLRMMAQVA